MSIGLLLLGIAAGISGIGCCMENHSMKKRTYKIGEQGRPTWLNRKAEQYINGEKVVYKYDYQKDKLVQVGEVTGTVYYDPYEVSKRHALEREEQHNARSRQWAVEHGHTTYKSYIAKFSGEHHREVSREISSGKYIAEIDKKKVGDEWKYYKYYLDVDSMPIKGEKGEVYGGEPIFPVNCRMPGTPGVEISKEEYEQLCYHELFATYLGSRHFSKSSYTYDPNPHLDDYLKNVKHAREVTKQVQEEWELKCKKIREAREAEEKRKREKEWARQEARWAEEARKQKEEERRLEEERRKERERRAEIRRKEKEIQEEQKKKAREATQFKLGVLIGEHWDEYKGHRY